MTTTPPIFPQLRGQGWSRTKAPSWETIVVTHPSARDIHAPLQPYPIWKFELTFNGLDSGAVDRGMGVNSFGDLFSFFMSSTGQWAQFLYIDPVDNSVVGQPLGTGDGATTNFTFVRTWGGATEPVGWVNGIVAVYVDGTPLSSGDWSGREPNELVLVTAPDLGKVVSADFNYYYLCRFSDDNEDFEQFMSNIWKVKTLKFQSLASWGGPPGTAPIVPEPFWPPFVPNPPPFETSAVHFAGSIQSEGPTYIEIPSLTTTDNGFFSFSFWAKGLCDPLNGNCTLWVTDPISHYINYLATNPNSGSQADFIIVYLGQYLVGPTNWQIFYPATDGAWHHYLGSYNANEPAGMKVGVLYIDDVPTAPSIPSDIDANVIPNMNGLPFYFGDDLFNDGPTIDLADVWIAPGVSLLTSPTTPTIPIPTRRQFTTAFNQPVNPATFPPAAILFSGDATTFPVNQGTGGAGAVTGTITNASTHP